MQEDWEPDDVFDTVFFGFWLSHVPPGHFARFWNNVDNALKPGGKVFFVDSLKTQRSTAFDHHQLDDSGIVERRVNSGERFKIVKRFYDPEQLLDDLSPLGWAGQLLTTEEFFLYGNVQRVNGGIQDQ